MPRMPVFWQSLLVWPDPRSSFISSWQRLEWIRSCLWVTSFLVGSLQLRSLFFLLSLQFLQLWISVSTTPPVIWWHPTNTPQCDTLSSAFAASFASACRVQHGTIHWVELIYGPSPWQLHQLLVVPSFEYLSNEAAKLISVQKNIYRFLLWVKNSVMSCNKFTTGFGVNKVVVHGWLPTADDGWSKDARLCQRHMCDSRLCLCPAKKHLQRPLLLPEIKEKTHHDISCIRYSSSVQVSGSIETFLFCHYLASKSADSEPCSGILIQSRHVVFLFGNDQPTNKLTRELKKAVSKHVRPCTSSYILSAKSLWSLNQTLRLPHVQMLGHAMFHASSWVSSKGFATLPHLWLSKRLPSCLWHLHRRSLCTTVSCVQHDQFARLASICPSCGLLSLFLPKRGVFMPFSSLSPSACWLSRCWCAWRHSRTCALVFSISLFVFETPTFIMRFTFHCCHTDLCYEHYELMNVDLHFDQKLTATFRHFSNFFKKLLWISTTLRDQVNFPIILQIFQQPALLSFKPMTSRDQNLWKTKHVQPHPSSQNSCRLSIKSTTVLT